MQRWKSWREWSRERLQENPGRARGPMCCEKFGVGGTGDEVGRTDAETWTDGQQTSVPDVVDGVWDIGEAVVVDVVAAACGAEYVASVNGQVDIWNAKLKSRVGEGDRRVVDAGHGR